MHRDQSALIREGSADLPAGENSTVSHFLLQGGPVYALHVLKREREFPFVDVPLTKPKKRVVSCLPECCLLAL